jgi:hypothetical protein
LAYQVAQVYAWRGENDKAFEWLQVSLDTHDTGTVSLLIDPLLRGLQDDPRYNRLLAKIGLPVRPRHQKAYFERPKNKRGSYTRY